MTEEVIFIPLVFTSMVVSPGVDLLVGALLGRWSFRARSGYLQGRIVGEVKLHPG